MKKTIKILSIIALVLIIAAPILSNIYAAIFINSYGTLTDIDFSIKLETFILTNVSVIFYAIVDVLICLFLLKLSDKRKNFVLEIIILAGRLVALPLIGSAYSYFLNLFINHIGIEAVQFLSAYSNLLNSFSILKSVAGTLIVMAIAFSISEKVHEKKLSSIEVTEN